MPGLAISQRLKLPHPKHPNTFVWRYRRVEEGRGVKTGSLEPPFFVRPTLADGSQPWVELDAQTFEQAKRERDQRERGEKLAAENTEGRTAIAAAVEDYLDSKKRKNDSTVQNYTYILREFLDLVSVKFIDEVNHKVMDGYITKLERNGAAPKTIVNKSMVVVFMLKHAGVLSPNKLVKNLLPEVEEEPAEPYTSDDLEKMFAKMTGEENERYMFFLVTACREQEVAHAEWKDIVMKGTVPHYIVRAKEFKYADGTPGRFTPKSHERREIPLTGELVDLLKERKKHSKSEWIFPNQNGDPEGHFLRKFKRIAFQAGLNCGKCHTTRSEGRYTKHSAEKCCKTYSEGCENHYLHRLRKTRATFWHHEGIPLRTIQHYLGHKSLETTQKYLGIEDAASVQDKINKPMF